MVQNETFASKSQLLQYFQKKISQIMNNSWRETKKITSLKEPQGLKMWSYFSLDWIYIIKRYRGRSSGFLN